MGALLSLLVFALSVWPGRATPGSELLNLRYRNERAVAANPKLVGPTGVGGPGLSAPQRLALGLGTVLLPSLLERLVGARLVWRQASMQRIISFEYLNRQLLWQQTAEALLLLLPMVDMQRLRRAAMRLLPRPATAAPAAAPAAPSPGAAAERAEGSQAPAEAAEAGAEAEAGEGKGTGARAAAAQAGPCPLCGAAEPLTAVLALPCRHAFCYYCLRGHTAADPWFACPRDGVRVAAMRRPGRAR
ncbi:hypothetical protein GPECTOR_142g710 [Gonium pectorale]|uniref:RING-type E3 ubiquitin transferase (cysteine targeting) n=1 Tax=Gonium pectorale TaxID=33097 RepID=A0A150FY12_GONPE|nr:hypothetical protein GPECTOR_142g710 [Gonium pectorale]|eukprot:KXZ42489.1 hypothetical protein GPECTOR_142g710 [Gonium pectorale]